jgi:hypothetical protein
VIFFALPSTVLAHVLEVFASLPVVVQSKSALKTTAASLALVPTPVLLTTPPLEAHPRSSSVSLEMPVVANVVAQPKQIACLLASSATLIEIHAIYLAMVRKKIQYISLS